MEQIQTPMLARKEGNQSTMLEYALENESDVKHTRFRLKQKPQMWYFNKKSEKKKKKQLQFPLLKFRKSY